MNNFSLLFEITGQCNQNCLYCYHTWKHKKSTFQEQNFKQLKPLLDIIIHHIKPTDIMIIGGEPFLHKDLFKILTYLSNSPIKIAISTNATLLDKKNIKKLLGLGVNYFEVSLDSINENIYSKLTQSKTLNKAKNNLLLLKKLGATINTSIMLTEINKHTILDTIDLAFAYQSDIISINRFVMVGMGGINQHELSISNDELIHYLSLINQKAQELNKIIHFPIPVLNCQISHQNYPFLKFGRCTCGEEKWLIDSSGNLKTCELSDEVLGNVVNTSFSELQQHKKNKTFKENNFSTHCTTCPIYKRCGGGCRFI